MPIRAAEDLGVRTFVFHEDPNANQGAVRVFEAIARVTGRVYLPFDRNFAGELAGLLSANAPMPLVACRHWRGTAGPLRGCFSNI